MKRPSTGAKSIRRYVRTFWNKCLNNVSFKMKPQTPSDPTPRIFRVISLCKLIILLVSHCTFEHSRTTFGRCASENQVRVRSRCKSLLKKYKEANSSAFVMFSSTISMKLDAHDVRAIDPQLSRRHVFFVSLFIGVQLWVGRGWGGGLALRGSILELPGPRLPHRKRFFPHPSIMSLSTDFRDSLGTLEKSS